jgi:hypothetical protein
MPQCPRFSTRSASADASADPKLVTAYTVSTVTSSVVMMLLTRWMRQTCSHPGQSTPSAEQTVSVRTSTRPCALSRVVTSVTEAVGSLSLAAISAWRVGWLPLTVKT